MGLLAQDLSREEEQTGSVTRRRVVRDCGAGEAGGGDAGPRPGHPPDSALPPFAGLAVGPGWGLLKETAQCTM